MSATNGLHVSVSPPPDGAPPPAPVATSVASSAVAPTAVALATAPPTTRRVRFEDGTPSPSSVRRTPQDTDPTSAAALNGLPSGASLTLPPSAMPAAAAQSSSSSLLSPTLTSAARRAELLQQEFAVPEVVGDDDHSEREESMSRSHASYSVPSVAHTDQGSSPDSNPPSAVSSPMQAQTRQRQLTLENAPSEASTLFPTQHAAFAEQQHPQQPARLSVSPSAPPRPTYAEVPGKRVQYVDAPVAPARLVQRSSDSGSVDLSHERSDSYSALGRNLAPVAPFPYQRTPSPQQLSAPPPPTIVAFSSRVKGSSVLFANPSRHRANSSSGSIGGVSAAARASAAHHVSGGGSSIGSLSGLSGAASAASSGGGLADGLTASERAGMISPIDFRHHTLANNAGYPQDHRAQQQPLATPSQMLALQQAAGANSQSQHYTFSAPAPENQRQTSHSRSASSRYATASVPARDDVSWSDGSGGAEATPVAGIISALGSSPFPGSPQSGGVGPSSDAIVMPHPSGADSMGMGSSRLAPLRRTGDDGVGHVMLPLQPGGLSPLQQHEQGLEFSAAGMLDAEDAGRDGSRRGGNGGDFDSITSARQRFAQPNSHALASANRGLVDGGDFRSNRSPLELSSTYGLAGMPTPLDSTLPLYTRILRIFLIAVGVVRYLSPERAKVQLLHSQQSVNGLGQSQGPLDVDGLGGMGGGVGFVARGATGAEDDLELDARGGGSGVDEVTGGVPARPPSPDDSSALPSGHRSRLRIGRLSSTARWTLSLRHFYFKIRSYLYPLLVFLFILTNVFFVTVSKHVNSDGSVNSRLDSVGTDGEASSSALYNNWISLVSDFCINSAPLLSWLGAFYMIGWSEERASLVFFEQLSNLEQYNRRCVRNYLIGAAVAGFILMATTNLTDISGSGASAKQSFFSLVNVGLFVLLNYLITTFVICALASLVCIFHYYSLSIFQEQLYSQDLTVQEAIREHIVLMRLQRESAKFVQYILFPPLLLYITGALLAGYNMLTTQVFSSLGATAFQLILAFVTLMIPLVSGAQITRVCGELARLATNLDLTSNLVERSSLIQQLVLLPGNAFFVFGVEVNYGLLAKVSYALIAGILVLARGASISTRTTS